MPLKSIGLSPPLESPAYVMFWDRMYALFLAFRFVVVNVYNFNFEAYAQQASRCRPLLRRDMPAFLSVLEALLRQPEAGNSAAKPKLGICCP